MPESPSPPKGGGNKSQESPVKEEELKDEKEEELKDEKDKKE